MKTGLKQTTVAPTRGFTLIELLVVVAIIAVLLSILLPSLGKARASARATVCGTNLSHVGKAMGVYLAENGSAYPFSYIYPNSMSGSYNPWDQPNEPRYGYIHWSHFLYNKGQADAAAFECPEFKNGGAPRTNPGPRAEHWEGPQQDHSGTTRESLSSDAIEDRQAPRVAFTGNAAVFPRNKFTTQLSGGPRVNRFVQEHEIESTGDTILATELHRDWRAAAVVRGGGGGDLLSKSHRPINPFFHVGYGSDEYSAPLGTPGFIYGVTTGDLTKYGLIDKNKLESHPIGLIDGAGGVPETNAVGRHHPGGDQLGGTANFLYVDGHVERRTILQTLKDREWGAKYYALTGETEVINRYGEVWDQ